MAETESPGTSTDDADESLSDDRSGNGLSSRKRLFYVTLEGAFANVFIVLTGGAFLTGLALYLGANDLEIGLLGAIPFLAQTAQLLSAYLVDRTGRRKSTTIWFMVVGRQVWWIVIPLLLLLTGSWQLPAFLAIFVFSSLALMIATPSWLAWMADIVPPKIRGRFFGQRNSAVAITTVASTILGGILLDRFRNIHREDIGFAILIGAACLFAMAAVLLMDRIPDRPSSSGRGTLTRAHFLEPLRDPGFRRLLQIFALWNLAIGTAAPFFAAHMLSNLRMSFTMIALYSSLHSIVAISFNRPWGSLIDRFGSRPVIVMCASSISFIPLIWWIPRQDLLWILAFEGIYSGFLWAGFNLAAFNVPIANSPKRNRTIYLAIFSVVTGIAFFAASLMGGWLAERWSDIHWQLGPQTVVNYHLLFAISSGLRLLSALLFLSFHEPKEKGIPIMIQFVGSAVLKRMSGGRQIFPGWLRSAKNE